MVKLITEHLGIWTAAKIPKANGGRGRGNNSNGQSIHGIKKLRELILELAVRGKLVPQDPNDEPANVLMEKIAKEKARLIKEGKIKKKKPLLEISKDEKPFTLPKGWEWLRIGDAGHDWGQKKPDKNFTYIDVSAIDNKAGIVKSPNILTATEAPSRARKIVRVGTVIYSTVRPYLKNITVIEKEYSPEPIASTAFAILHPFQKMSGKYIANYLKSPTFISYVELVQTGIAYPAINDKQLFIGNIPIPPLAEQHRIVAKVDELMALCDQLEQQQTDSNETHQILVETLLATLTQAADQSDYTESWQRIVNHFDTLFTTETSIAHLKQTILQLAVMGKLVPQDLNDEPASVLLEKIAKEKVRLIKEGKIKKQKPLPEISDDEKLFELPIGWKWVRLGTYSIVFSGNSFKSEDFNTEGGVKVIKITNAGVGEFIETEEYLPEIFLEEYMSFIVKKNDLIIALTRPYISTGLKISKCPSSYNNSLLNQRVAAVRFVTDENYAFLFIQSMFVLNLYKNRFSGSGLQPNLKVSDVTELVLPVPPQSEQHRIVAKVDELMALCDDLKIRLKDAQTTQVQLADAIVEQAAA